MAKRLAVVDGSVVAGNSPVFNAEGDLVDSGGAGSLSWVTKTSNYTALEGDCILADTSGGTFIITLPATPGAGDTVTIADAGNTASINLTVARNGSTIEGLAEDLIVDVPGAYVSFIYSGTTWQIFVNSASAGGALALFEEQSSTFTTWDTVEVQRAVFELHPRSTEIDVHINIAPKGEGSIHFCPIDSHYNYTTGYNCADLQVSASYGVSGLWNTGLGTTCFTADNVSGSISGGMNCGVYGTATNPSTGALALGYYSLASGDGSSALGGGIAFAPGSFAVNYGAVYGVEGQQANGSTLYYATGWPDNGRKSAQYTSTHLTRVTTDATASILTAGGAAPVSTNVDFNGKTTAYNHDTVRNVNTIQISSVAAITARVIAASVTATPTGIVNGDVADFEIKATVYRGPQTTDNVIFIGTPTVTVIQKTAGATSWTVSLVVDQTRRSVEIQVTGEAARVIRWSARLDTVEV